MHVPKLGSCTPSLSIPDLYCFENSLGNALSATQRSPAQSRQGAWGPRPCPDTQEQLWFLFHRDGEATHRKLLLCYPISSSRHPQAQSFFLTSLGFCQYLGSFFAPLLPQLNVTGKNKRQSPGVLLSIAVTYRSDWGEDWHSWLEWSLCIICEYHLGLWRTAVLQLASLHPCEIHYRWYICPLELSVILTCMDALKINTESQNHTRSQQVTHIYTPTSATL